MKKREVQSDLKVATKTIERIEAKIEKLNKKKGTFQKRYNIATGFVKASFVAFVLAAICTLGVNLKVASETKGDVEKLESIYEEIVTSESYTEHYNLKRAEIGARIGSGSLSLEDAKEKLETLSTRDYVLSVAPTITPNLYNDYVETKNKIDDIEEQYKPITIPLVSTTFTSIAAFLALNVLAVNIKDDRALDKKIFELERKKILLTADPNDEGEDFDFSKIM